MPARPRSASITAAPPAPSGQGKLFENEASVLLTRLRSTLTEMLSGIPGGVRKSRDVHKYLGVDANLSWQLMKLLTAPDALSAARYVPGEFPMRRVFDLARQIGISQTRVAAAEAASSALSQFVLEHAGDRDSFESMVAARDGADSEEDDAVGLAHRKAIFKGHSHYWGLQIDVQMVAMILHPTAGKPGRFDYLHVRTMKGLRRLRATASVHVDSYKLQAPSPEEENRISYMAIDEDARQLYGAPVLPEFCSSPVPAMHTSTDAGGRTNSELAGDAVGRRSQVDLTFGTIASGGPLSPLANGGQGFGSLMRISKPTALLVADVLVHRSTLPNVEVRLLCNGHVNPSLENFDFNDPKTRLPLTDRVRLLGQGADVTPSLDIPRQRELFEHVCARRGWNLNEFNVYRARVEYPLMETAISMVFEVR